MDIEQINRKILSKIDFIDFKPLPLIKTGHQQTVTAFYLPKQYLISNKISHAIELKDSDKIVIIENKPSASIKQNRIILMVHGLTGSSNSKYLRRQTRLLTQHGYHTFRVNLRGCGEGKGLAKNLYHSGRSEDLRAVLNWLKEQYPDTPVTLIGYSLGGNISLKLAGEDKNQPTANLDSVISVSPPLDLYKCTRLLEKKPNIMFNNFFVKGLLSDIPANDRNSKFNFSGVDTVLKFDNIYTAPKSGFKDAIDYYNKCSSKNFVNNIEIPTFILFAKDDPFIAKSDFFKIKNNHNIDLLMTKYGGHVGWLGKTDQAFHYRWMDRVVFKWINWFHNYSG